jgi:hypothetical protein
MFSRQAINHLDPMFYRLCFVTVIREVRLKQRVSDTQTGR